MTSGNNSAHLDDNVILKNAADLIYYAGLMKIEVMKLRIRDVQKKGQIVWQIQPVSDTYPPRYTGTGIRLSSESRDILIKHIQYLQSGPRMHSPSAPLFPVVSSGRSYTKKRFSEIIRQETVYGTYVEHRESGIRRFAWELYQKGLERQQILDETHRFSRYRDQGVTERVVEEGLLQNPEECDALYRRTYELARKVPYLVTHRWEEKIQPVLEELENEIASLCIVRHRLFATTSIKKLWKNRRIEIIASEDLFPGRKSPAKHEPMWVGKPKIRRTSE